MRRDSAGWRSLARRTGGRATSIVGALIERRERWLPPVLLACVTLVSFLPTLKNGFVGDWDDDVILVNNPSYRGLGWPHLRWMFTTFLAGHYMPLTWLTFGLDYLARGMNPVGYHLTNLLAGAGLRTWCAAKARRLVQARRLAVLAAVVVAIGLGTLTWRQVHVWHDLRSLWTRAVDTYPSATAHYNLAVFLFREGDIAGAITHYRSALAIKPDFAEAHNNLGVALAREGRLDEAILQFQEALKINPDGVEAHYGLGLALVRQGRQREAVDHFRRALSISPGFQDAQRNLDRALAESRLAR